MVGLFSLPPHSPAPPDTPGTTGHAAAHRWARRSILGSATQTVRLRIRRRDTGPIAFIGETIDWASDAQSHRHHRETVADPWQALASLIDGSNHNTPPTAEPSTNPSAGWYGWIGYDLARFIEPTASIDPAHAKLRDGHVLFELHRVEAPATFDHASSAWDGQPIAHAEPLVDHPSREPFIPLTPLMPGDNAERAYRAGVERIRARITEGDVYQVNLAHPLRATLIGDQRAIALKLIERLRPWYAATIEAGPMTSTDSPLVCSLSPELFLEYDASTRRVTTRPIKGTRPLNTAPDELTHAAKDRAELMMIVDLMRNDLGRVCVPGSVRVPELRAIETHAVQHAVATITGTLAPNATRADLLRATFPPGSITGAPKIAAMRIIDELETEPRGPYCGCLGAFTDDGNMTLNVAIRTATITPTPHPDAEPGTLELVYRVGAGIVADSNPEAEWRETLDKAEAVARALTEP